MFCYIIDNNGLVIYSRMGRAHIVNRKSKSVVSGYCLNFIYMQIPLLIGICQQI